jgi:guanylate kinase
MSAIARRGLCLVLAAPSGTGKTSVARALTALEPGLTLSISATTRQPRPGERDGIDYHFRTQAEFDALIAGRGLLEWARVMGRDCYGTPRAPVETALAAGRDMIFDIDWQGYRSLRTALPGDVVGVFLLPPRMDALADRLRTRGADDKAEIARRMARARAEIAHCAEFDHVTVNEEFDRTVTDVRAILHAARLATGRLNGLREFVAGLEG